MAPRSPWEAVSNSIPHHRQPPPVGSASPREMAATARQIANCAIEGVSRALLNNASKRESLQALTKIVLPILVISLT